MSTSSDSRDPAAGAPPAVAVPRWLPPLVYGVVTLVLFRDFVFSSEMLFGADTESLGYMAREFFAERLEEGDVPLWNPLILGGTPFLDSLAGGDSLYPPSVLLLILTEPYRALGWKLVLHVFAAGLFTYGWVRALGSSRAAALVAGLAFMVGPFFVTLVFPAHDGKIFVTALTPLLFWAVEAWFSRRRLPALAGVGAVVALVILTTHFQMAYFLFLAVGAYAVFRTVQVARGEGEGTGLRPGLVAFGAFLAASLAGTAAAGVQLLPAVEYVTEYSRRTATTTQADPAENRAYASSWGLHPEEALATLAVPEFVGSNITDFAPATTTGRPLQDSWVDRTYWGRNAFKLNHEYLGLAAVLLGILAFVGARQRGLLWFMVGLGGVALAYALATYTPIWTLFYAVVPGIQLFRAPSMAIFLSGFAVATLAAFGVDRVLAWATAGSGGAPDAGRRGQFVLVVAVAALGFGTLLASAGSLTEIWQTLFYADLPPERMPALRAAEPFISRGFLLATGLALALFAVVWAGRQGLLKPAGIVAALAVIVAVDGIRVDLPYLHTRDFDAWSAPDPNTRFLVERAGEGVEPFRVLDLNRGGQEVRLGMFGLELAAGHHPNDLAPYRTLIGMEGSGLPRNLLAAPVFNRLLNVEYVVWPARQYGPLEEQIQGLPGLQGAEAVNATQLPDGGFYEAVYRLPGVLPRARLVGSARVASDDEVVGLLASGAVDPARTALLAPEFADLARAVSGDGSGTVRWIERTADRNVLEVASDDPSLLVLADNWYPSWRATVDGRDVPVGRAYLTLRAVPVPAGRHTVVVENTLGTPVRRGLVATVGGWLLLAGLALAGWYRHR
jgi:hypothetical protein